MRKSKGVVLFDMDGVLADFDNSTETFLRTNHPDITINPRQNFYYRDDYPDTEQQEIINSLHTSQYFFQNLPEIPGGINAWNQVRALGYETRICTAPMPGNEWCIDEKLAWIQTHLGAAAAREAIIDSAKENYDGIALIDDRPVIKNAELARWQHVVFGQPYNLHIDTPFRLENWQDTGLETILARCAALYSQLFR